MENGIGKFSGNPIIVKKVTVGKIREQFYI